MRSWLTNFACYLFLIFCATGVYAHSWYDLECCSERDCSPVGSDNISITDEGVLLTLDRGEHPFVFGELEALIPWGDPRIRKSKDSEHHACIAPPVNDFLDGPDETNIAGYVLCVYIAAVA
ncbi:MAG: hypothetical protein AAFX78_02765 [Cyanobacteria bacterium J06638_20]